jgi:hypothetical protein
MNMSYVAVYGSIAASWTRLSRGVPLRRLRSLPLNFHSAAIETIKANQMIAGGRDIDASPG